MGAAVSGAARFDRFVLHFARGVLLSIEGQEIALRPKAFALLRLFVENAGRLLDHDTIMQAVWAGRTISDDGITQCVRDIRRALGDDKHRILRTITRRGYVLAAEVTNSSDRAVLVSHTFQFNDARALQQRDNQKEIRLAILPPRALGEDSLGALSLGFAEEVTAALLQFRWITCVDGARLARDGGLAMVFDHAWQQLGIDYLLDSTLQRSGDRIRIIVRLLDIHADGKVAWARRFDRKLDDVLTLQGEIAAETAAQIDPELLIREGERLVSRGLGEPTTYDLILRAIPAIYRLAPSGFRAAGEMLREALAIEPDNAAAHAWLAYWHVLLVGQGWADDPVAATQRAGALAERAVTLDPSDARSLALVGHVRGFLFKRPAEARTLYDRAISLNPNLPLAWCLSGMTHSYLGMQEEAITQITRAQRLSPHDPHSFFFDGALMVPHFLCGDFDATATLGRRAIELNSSFSSTYKGCLAALGHLGRDGEAVKVLSRLLVLEPTFSVRSAVERSPLMRSEDLTLYVEGLRRAGVREG